MTEPAQHTPPEGVSQWVTTTEAAEILGVSVDTVRRLTDAGALPSWRATPTAYRRYDRAVLAAYRANAGTL